MCIKTGQPDFTFDRRLKSFSLNWTDFSHISRSQDPYWNAHRLYLSSALSLIILLYVIMNLFLLVSGVYQLVRIVIKSWEKLKYRKLLSRLTKDKPEEDSAVPSGFSNIGVTPGKRSTEDLSVPTFGQLSIINVKDDDELDPMYKLPVVDDGIVDIEDEDVSDV